MLIKIMDKNKIFIYNIENKKTKIKKVIYKDLNPTELIEQNIKYKLWNKSQLIDYINYLNTNIEDYEFNL